MKVSNLMVLIVEDELPARKLISKNINSRTEFSVIHSAKNGKEALEKLSHNSYDLMLCDIHLPDMSGFEILSKLNKPVNVIFCTAFDKYAIRAFHIGAIDYLLKPFSIDRFNKAIDQFISKTTLSESTEISIDAICFTFSFNKIYYIVAYEDILYIEANANKTIVHTVEESLQSSFTLKETEQLINDQSLLRLHKRYILNLHHITDISRKSNGKYDVLINNNPENKIPIGEQYTQTFKKHFET